MFAVGACELCWLYSCVCEEGGGGCIGQQWKVTFLLPDLSWVAVRCASSSPLLHTRMH